MPCRRWAFFVEKVWLVQEGWWRRWGKRWSKVTKQSGSKRARVFKCPDTPPPLSVRVRPQDITDSKMKGLTHEIFVSLKKGFLK